VQPLSDLGQNQLLRLEDAYRPQHYLPILCNKHNAICDLVAGLALELAAHQEGASERAVPEQVQTFPFDLGSHRLP
jgi:hypothetical protein